MDVLALMLAAVAVAMAARYLLARLPSRRRKRELTALRKACHGDQDLAERLVLSELERERGIDFGEAARRARVRLKRDRR